MDDAIEGLVGVLGVLLTVGSVFLGASVQGWCEKLDQERAKVAEIARKNAQGKVCHTVENYAKSKLEGKAHIALQMRAREHAHNQSFYSNTFTGWRKRYYNRKYSETLREKQVMVLARKHEAAEVKKELQRVDGLKLEERLRNNLLEVKN